MLSLQKIVIRNSNLKTSYQYHTYMEMSDDVKQMMSSMMKQQGMIMEKLNDLQKKPEKKWAYDQDPSKNTPLNTTTRSRYLSNSSTQKPSSSKIASQRVSRTTCPQKHYSNKIYQSNELCNDCSQQVTGGQLCMECNFHVCRNCIKIYHEDFCQEEMFVPYFTRDFCVNCGQQHKGGKTCTKCHFKMCRVCSNPKHEMFCSSSEYIYYSSHQFCLNCGRKRTGGKRCTICQYKICRKCEL